MSDLSRPVLDGVLAALLVAGAGGAMLAASLGGSRPAVSERVTREGGTIFLGESLMHRAYALAEPLAGACVRAGIGADALSWLGLALGVGAGVAVAVRLPGMAAWLLALGGGCDLLDGAVARRSAQPGRGGAVLDSALDRYSEAAFHAGLLVWYAGAIGWQLLVLASLFGGMMVTYSTAKAEALAIPPPRAWMKRPERVVWLLLGAVATAISGAAGGPRRPVMAAALAIVAVFANLSAVRRLAALRRAAEFTAPKPPAGVAAPQTGSGDRSSAPRPPETPAF